MDSVMHSFLSSDFAIAEILGCYRLAGGIWRLLSIQWRTWHHPHTGCLQVPSPVQILSHSSDRVWKSFLQWGIQHQLLTHWLQVFHPDLLVACVVCFFALNEELHGNRYLSSWVWTLYNCYIYGHGHAYNVANNFSMCLMASFVCFIFMQAEQP